MLLTNCLKSSRFFGIIGLAIYVSGCALQMPVSEGMVFKDKDDPFIGENNFELPVRFVGGQLVSSNVIVPSSKFKDAAFARFGSDSATVLNENFLRNFSSPGILMSFFDVNRFAIAYTPGAIVVGGHVDATLRAVDEIYITANHNFHSNHFELIVQRPVIKRNAGGISLGAFYRNEKLQFENEFDKSLGNREESFRVRWFGLRTLGQSPRIHNEVPVHFKGHINAGYAPDFNAALFTLGISISIL